MGWWVKKVWEGECWGFVFPRKSLPYPPQTREGCGEKACDFSFLDEGAPALSQGGRGWQSHLSATGSKAHMRRGRGQREAEAFRCPTRAISSTAGQRLKQMAPGAAERGKTSRWGRCSGERCSWRPPPRIPAPAGSCNQALHALFLFSLLDNIN